jgi:hypothetical protein
VEEVTGDLFFSYLNLDQVSDRINVKSNYGDIKLLAVDEGFQRMDFASQYSDITLYLGQDHLYNLDITRDDRSQIISSADLISKDETPAAGAEKTYRVAISAGKSGKPAVPVAITIKAGKIYLMGK